MWCSPNTGLKGLKHSTVYDNKRVGMGLTSGWERAHTGLCVTSPLCEGTRVMASIRDNLRSSWEQWGEAMEEQVARMPAQALPPVPASTEVPGSSIVLQCHGGALL